MGKINQLNETIEKIRNMQAKWGLSQTNISKNSESIMEAGTINSLKNDLRNGKSKSGWPGVVTGNVDVGSVIRNVLTAMNEQADSIKSYCSCNCNYCSCNCNHCSCNCNHCSCNCDYCNCDNDWYIECGAANDDTDDC